MADDPIAEYGALFERDGTRVVPTQLARGPWDPRAQHGGAPSALFAHACERHDRSEADFLARLTVELLRPVPLTPLELTVRTLRPGRKVHWLEAALHTDDGTEVARATALRIRTSAVDPAHTGSPTVEAPPPPDAGHAPSFAFFGPRDVGYWSANELRLVRGNWGEPGPAIAWVHLLCPVLAGEPNSPAMRVAAAADFGSGVGSPVQFPQARAINAELTIHLFRHLTGEWVGLESGGWASPGGVGFVESRLHDIQGVVGRAGQALLVEGPLPPG